ncbi:MAG: HAD-IIA family hydrolase [Candidatus Krumholzibacteria bacterium]|nr:HAD-IIA family hydrolase [Candidatus Krumholzibacteria bacterium]
MKKTDLRRGFLIDIEGVLVRDKRYEPIAGAVPWLRALREAGTPFCLVSNNTTHRPAELIGDLVAAGFPVTEDHLVGALDLGRRWLQERGRRRIMWLGTADLATYWAEMGFELVTGGACEAVVLGANAELSVGELDQALGAVLEQGADVVCLHRNPFFLDAEGQRRLGPGAWAAALEAVGGTGAVITVGKPSEKIYNEAIKRIGVAPAEALFISDDPVNDLVTAGQLGMTTAFVLSGKHPDHEILGRLAEEDWPDIICNSLADLERPADCS